MRKNKVYKKLCKIQYKVRFGTGRKIQGNGLFFQTVFFGGDLGGRQQNPVPGIKRKPNLEPSTGGFREKSKTNSKKIENKYKKS